MSKNWVEDMAHMHEHYKVHDWVEKNKDNPELMKKLLKFRLDFLQEELNEAYGAMDADDAEEVVDAMIDLCVVAIGTLDIYRVDSHKAWNEILRANMAKEPGVKPSRPNPLGLPDLIKPEGWTGPDHTGNHGLLGKDE
jgi:predicted HAD superfamily Cof-like phosphohydrolase